VDVDLDTARAAFEDSTDFTVGLEEEFSILDAVDPSSRAISAEDGGLAEIIERAIAADPDAAEQVRQGNMRAVGPLVGFVMKETKGRADGGEITRLIRERVGSGS